MTAKQWFPDRLYVGNVRDRALISDSYLISELRADPWRGFDLSEGYWLRTRRHEYELETARTVKDVRRTLSSIQPWIYAGKYGHNARMFPVEVVPSEETAPDGLALMQFRVDGVTGYVNRDFLATLTRLVDGEPSSWYTASDHSPLNAYWGQRWVGAIMPVRMPEVASVRY